MFQKYEVDFSIIDLHTSWTEKSLPVYTLCPEKIGPQNNLL